MDVEAHCFNFMQHTHALWVITPPPRRLWPNDWPTTGINRPHGALFLLTRDSWLYSQSWWSVSYLCWGNLVLFPRVSAPPPLFAGRAREARMSHRIKWKEMAILGSSRWKSLYSHWFDLWWTEGSWWSSSVFSKSKSNTWHVHIKFQINCQHGNKREWQWGD